MRALFAGAAIGAGVFSWVFLQDPTLTSMNTMRGKYEAALVECERELPRNRYCEVVITAVVSDDVREGE